MGLREGVYATVWSASQKGKAYSCQVSVSQKDKESGEYKTLYSGFVNFAGNAADKVAALGLPERMDRNNNSAFKRVRITSGPDVTTWYNKERVERLTAKAGNDTELVNFIKANCDSKNITIWDIDVDDGGSRGGSRSGGYTKKPSPRSAPAQQYDDDDSYELPF